LHTGRKHQIRVQLAALGCPIVGDRKYGSKRPLVPEAIALHCVRLALEHPVSQKRLVFEVPPPAYWQLRDHSLR
jgi:23S rRNA pseudouridine1911/1915/1917 synthase